MTTVRPTRGIFRELLAPLGLAAAFLLPILETGYLSDDLAHSLTPGIIQLNECSPLEWTLRSTAEMIGKGRFYPGFFFHSHAVYNIFRDLVAYKAMVLSLVLLDLALLYALVRRLGGDRGLAGLAAAMTVGIFQFRAYSDPILAFHGHQQVSSP